MVWNVLRKDTFSHVQLWGSHHIIGTLMQTGFICLAGQIQAVVQPKDWSRAKRRVVMYPARSDYPVTGVPINCAPRLVGNFVAACVTHHYQCRCVRIMSNNVPRKGEQVLRSKSLPFKRTKFVSCFTVILAQMSRIAVFRTSQCRFHCRCGWEKPLLPTPKWCQWQNGPQFWGYRNNFWQSVAWLPVGLAFVLYEADLSVLKTVYRLSILPALFGFNVGRDKPRFPFTPLIYRIGSLVGQLLPPTYLLILPAD